MKGALLGSLLLLSTWGGLTRIHDRNEAIARGAAAYARHDYTTAAHAYKEAALRLGSKEEAVWLNLAHATARLGRAAEARSYYSRLSTSTSPLIRSIALQQLGTLAAGKADYVQALALLRQALQANPANTDARHNYELLRDYLTRRSQQPQLPPPSSDGGPSQEQQDQGAKPGTDQQGQRNDPNQPQDRRNAPQAEANPNGQPDANQPPSSPGTSATGGFRPGAGEQRSMAQGSEPGSVRGLSNEGTGPDASSGSSHRGGTEAASHAEANIQTQRARLQQMNISAGQAQQILNALHAAEQQYLQQLPRKASKPKDKNAPGW